MSCEAVNHKYRPHATRALLFCELCGDIIYFGPVKQEFHPRPKEIFRGEGLREETNRETANRLEAEVESMSFEQEIDALMKTGMSFEQAVDAITERVMRESGEPKQTELNLDDAAKGYEDGNPRRVTVDDADDDRLVNTPGI